ncbi:hypothetical protein ACNOYE_23150 [Nannocystaceae bacterium ST9]
MRSPSLGSTLVIALAALPASATAAGPELALPTGAWRDTTCFRIDHACGPPSSLTVSLADADLVDWHASAIEASAAPSSICIDVDGLGSGPALLHVEETCEGRVESTQATVTLDDLGFELLGVGVEPWVASAGATIEVEIETDLPGLDVAIDFSPVDPGYASGSETVVDRGEGRYLVTYTLPSTGGPATGTYALPVRLHDRATGRSRTWLDLAQLRFAPQGLPSFVVAGEHVGEWVFADVPSEPPLLPAASIVPGSLVVVAGEVASLRGYFDLHDGELPRASATIYLAEPGTSGALAVPLHAEPDACWSSASGTTCRYGFAVEFERRASSTATTSHPIVGVRPFLFDAGVDDPLAFSGIEFVPVPPLGWFPSQQTGQYTIRGRVDYRRNVISHGPAVPADPQYGNGGSSFVVTPLAHARVEVRDGCDHVHPGLTDEDGSFELIFATTCPHLVAEVVMVSESTRGFVRVDVRDTQGELHEFPIASFTPAAAAVQELPADLIPLEPAATFDILQQLSALQRFGKELLGDAHVGTMPWAHAIFERGWCPVVEGTSRYEQHLDEIQICSADGVGEQTINRDEFDQFVILHEGFHWFHHHFLVQGLAESVYSGPTRDFTEGFATTMAGLLLGTAWKFERLAGGDADKAYGQHVFTVESLDFNGHTSYDPDMNPTERWLPVDLWGQGTPASSSGGWAWRILWDVADPEQPTVPEPHTVFVRGRGGPWAVEVPADFDRLGGMEMFVDALVGYLHSTPVNPELKPLDDRGFTDLDTVEVLDAIVCRSAHAWDSEVDVLVDVVMDFRQYNPAQAPSVCP